jgi:hypothetical protein
MDNLKTLESVNSSLETHSKVLVMSNDLDGYALMPMSLRRDFAVKDIRTWFIAPGSDAPQHLSEDSSSREGRIAYGLCFDSFMGRKVDGRYASPATVILSAWLMEHSSAKGFTVVQLVPDFAGYKRACQFIGDFTGNSHIKARSTWSDHQLAEHLSEEFTINMFGVFMAMLSLRGNPYAADIIGNQVSERVRHSKLLSSADEMWKFCRDIGLSYNLYKSPDFLSNLATAAIAASDKK